MHSFEDIREPIRTAYKMLHDNMTKDKMGEGDPFPGHTDWDVLYGHETTQAILKLREAMMWLGEAEVSVG